MVHNVRFIVTKLLTFRGFRYYNKAYIGKTMTKTVEFF